MTVDCPRCGFELHTSGGVFNYSLDKLNFCTNCGDAYPEGFIQKLTDLEEARLKLYRKSIFWFFMLPLVLITVLIFVSIIFFPGFLTDLSELVPNIVWASLITVLGLYSVLMPFMIERRGRRLKN